MKIKELLTSDENKLATIDPGIIDIEAALAEHDDSNVRLYLDPRNKRTYWIVRQEDIIQELRPLSSEQLAVQGLSGYKMFVIPVRRGAEIQTVVIELHRVGETLVPGNRSARIGECVTDQQCSQTCCNVRTNGCSCSSCCVG